MGLLLSACERPTYKPPPTPTPEAIPTPTPTPTIPRKPLDVAQLFNGITVFTKFETPPSDQPASFERNEADSYKLQITFTDELPEISLYFDPSVVAHVAALTGPRLIAPGGTSAWDIHQWELK